MGGGERVLLDLLERLDRSRVRPLLAALEGGELLDRARGLGVDVFVIPGGGALYALSRRSSSALDLARAAAGLAASTRWVERRIRERKIDVIVTNSLKGGHVHGAIAGRLTRARVIARVHDVAGPPSFSPLALRALALSLRLADRILPVSRAAANALVTLGLPASRIRVLYNGVDVPAPDPGARERVRRELDLPPEALVLASIGRLTPWKGQHVLLEAVPALVPRFPTLRVLVAGAPHYDTDAYERELRTRVAGGRLEGRVRLLGHRGDVPDLLRASDLLVHTSLEPDPLPTVLLEALASGTFVVASGAGGVTEIVTSDRVGLLYPPGDVAALVAAVARALTEERDRRASEAERLAVLERFSMPRYVSEFTTELTAV